MRFVLSVILVSLVGYANATNYYFSSSSGDDSRSASQAKSSSTPWKSISKLNSIFSTLQPGDSVLFKKGDTFYGTITIRKSGSSTRPIVISSYGSGNKPIITSFITLSGWVSKGGGVYESYNSNLSSSLNYVAMNDIPEEMGRYPNSTAHDKGYLTFESHSGKTSITDKNFSSSTNWAGAELVLRSRRWVLDRNILKSNSGTTIYYSTTSSYEPYNNMGYFIQDHIKTLDALGEWYYNSSTKKVSFFFGSAGPSLYKVQASSLDYVILSDGYSNITFDNLNVKGSNLYGICIKSGSNITIQKCDVNHSGRDGINVSAHEYLTIKESTISNSNCNGINLNYTGDHATISGNKINNTSVLPGMGTNGDGKGIGIYTNGDYNVIEYNEVTNTGYIGISFKGNNVTIKNNLIDSFCLVKDDGAGIYSHLGDAPDYKNRKIIGNIVLNGVGAGYGTDNPSYFPSEGIYFDDGTSYIELSGNTVANCGNNGIYLHNAHDLIIKNNTFYNSNRQFTAIQKVDHDNIRNNTITNNIFFSKQATQLTSYLKSSANDINLFGKMDSNYYARPIDDRLTIFSNYPKTSTSSTTISQNYQLESWQDKYNKDNASKRSAKQILPYRLNKILSGNKISNGLFSSTLDGVSKASCTISWSNDGKMDGGYLIVKPSARYSTVFMNIGSLTAGKKYLLKYSLRTPVDSTLAIGAVLRQAASPYANLMDLVSRPATTSKVQQEVYFTCPSTQSSASIVFRADDQTTYYIDNISFYEVDATATNINDSLKFVYNASKTTKSISLSGTYVDVKNKSYSSSISLAPYTSAVLIKKGGASTSTNSSPSISLTSPLNNSTFKSPASITISANASDADGSISKVEFYKGSTLLTTELTAPYSWTWSNVASGTYSITAKAYDNDGNVKTSSAANITVGSGTAPIVSVTSPITNSKYNSLADIKLAATASDPGGSITKVEFYSGSKLITTEVNAPYEWTWNNVPSGSYSITAKAYDNSGNVTKSPNIYITVGSSTSLAMSVESSQLLSLSTDALSMNAPGSQNNRQFSKELPLSFNAYPNPAVNSINLNITGTSNASKTQVSIYNTAGLLIKNVILSSKAQNAKIDISSLISGLYFIELSADEKSVRKEFLKIN